MEHPVILFDGECALCHGCVRFIVGRDSSKRFRFMRLQSGRARRLLEQHGVTDAGSSSVILVEGGRIYAKSSAALRIARRLDGPVSLLYLFILVPPFLRHAVYDFIGSRRYRWFGRGEECRLPEGSVAERFLDRDDEEMTGNC